MAASGGPGRRVHWALTNLDRSHQGYRLRGRTPAQALQEALGIEEIPPVVTASQEEAQEAA